MLPIPRLAPTIGLIAQITLLAVLGATTGLGVVGWAAGLAYAVALCTLLACGLASAAEPFGPADWVTLARAVLVGGVTALAADSLTRQPGIPVLVAITTAALVLDALDGQVARRTGTASGFGARFDMEVDAFLILVLSAHVARSAGAWVLAIGAMRYAYAAAAWVLPWLSGPLPPRYWRKVVAAIQGIVLVVAIAGVLPPALSHAALLAALALLVESFGRDVLWRRRHAVTAADQDVAAGPSDVLAKRA